MTQRPKGYSSSNPVRPNVTSGEVLVNTREEREGPKRRRVVSGSSGACASAEMEDLRRALDGDDDQEQRRRETEANGDGGIVMDTNAGSSWSRSLGRSGLNEKSLPGPARVEVQGSQNLETNVGTGDEETMQCGECSPR